MGKQAGVLSLAAFAAVGLISIAQAHHGTSGSYDQNKIVKLTGVVKEFRWRNPHSALFLVAKDATGNDATFALEMGSPNTLVRMGFTRALIKPGDTVEVEMHPSYTGPHNGEALSRQIVVNGKVLKDATQASR
jgi:hypothetical protein